MSTEMIADYKITIETRPMSVTCVLHGAADLDAKRWALLETFGRAICESCFNRLAAAFSK